MRIPISVLGLLMLACPLTAAPAPPAAAESLELIQRRDVQLHHQRMVGNIRAQAKRSGIVVKVPQLYVYFTDRTEAWHLGGFRTGFLRELELTVNHQQRERTMVRIDRLLERTVTPEGGEITPADLPDGDLYFLLYRRADCADCERVEDTLGEWLDDQPERAAVWIDIWLDRQPQSDTP